MSSYSLGNAIKIDIKTIKPIKISNVIIYFSFDNNKMGSFSSKTDTMAQQPETYGKYTVTEVGPAPPRKSWWAKTVDEPAQSGGKKTKKTVRSKPKSKKST